MIKELDEIVESSSESEFTKNSSDSLESERASFELQGKAKKHRNSVTLEVFEDLRVMQKLLLMEMKIRVFAIKKTHPLNHNSNNPEEQELLVDFDRVSRITVDNGQRYIKNDFNELVEKLNLLEDNRDDMVADTRRIGLPLIERWQLNQLWNY